uniref:Uncharacterized protein n=1 Tax=Anguilla anguilla TaxID=7936 RepID=A0A0E9R432_ANGAN
MSPGNAGWERYCTAAIKSVLISANSVSCTSNTDDRLFIPYTVCIHIKIYLSYLYHLYRAGSRHRRHRYHIILYMGIRGGG